MRIDDLILDPFGAVILEKNVLVSDLHIGIEREVGLSKWANTNIILNKLEIIKNKYDVDTLIMVGDIKHRFDLEDIDLVRYFIDKANKIYNKIIWIGGNHDNGAKYVRDSIEILDKVVYGKYIIQHGDKLRINRNKKIIIGHEHPVIELWNGYRSARYICFLDFGNVLIMPAFNNISPGNDVLSARFSNKRLNKERWNAYVYISDDNNIYKAGKLGDIAVKIYGDIPKI